MKRFFLILTLWHTTSLLAQTRSIVFYGQFSAQHFPGSRLRAFTEQPEQTAFPLYGIGAGYSWATKKRATQLVFQAGFPRKDNRIVPGTLFTPPTGVELERRFDYNINVETTLKRRKIKKAQYGLCAVGQVGTFKDKRIYASSALFPISHWEKWLGIGTGLTAYYPTRRGRSITFSLPFILAQGTHVTTRINNPVLTFRQQRQDKWELKFLRSAPVIRVGVGLQKLQLKDSVGRKDRLEKRKKQVRNSFFH
jgi:hypothetical protein